ncbi:MAG: hypothetical protein WCS34_02310 [Bacteroidales bacterium]
MKKIAANYIITLTSLPLRNHYIKVDSEQKIIEIEPLDKEFASTAFYNGLIVPEQINLAEDFPIKDLQNILDWYKNRIEYPEESFKKFIKFKIGSKIGAVLIKNFDFLSWHITDESEIIKLL